MANNERLTKRVKKMEEWVAENEDMGGPKGYLDTFVQMYNMNGNLSVQAQQTAQRFEQLRKLVFKFMSDKELVEEWDTFIGEQDDAVQEQQAEEESENEEEE